jgi:hypothetical protein
MSLPLEADFALVKMGDGEDPEVFTAICGIQDVQVNKSAQTSDRFVRDCAKPGEVPFRKVRTTGKQMDISGSGLSNVATIEDLEAALGVAKNYKIELYEQDGTDAGNLLGTYAGQFVMTTDNLTAALQGDSTGETNFASHGAWTYTAAA